MTKAASTATAARTGPGTGARIGIGFVLLLPALLALAWSYLLPTVLAVWRSTTRDNLLRPAESVGTANYQARFDQGILGDFGWALLLALVPLALALLVAPLLALLADRAGRPARLAARALLAVPVAGYAPVALLVGWRLDRVEPAEAVDRPYATLAELTAVGAAGLVVAVATTAFLGTLRGRRHRRDALPAAMTVAGLLLFGILAATLQSFTAPLLTGRTRVPLTHVVMLSLTRMDLGGGSAAAVLLLIPLALLGLAATALLLASRARIEMVDEGVAGGEHPDGTVSKVGPGDGAAGGGSRRAGIGLAVAGAFLIGLMLWAAWPWLRRSFRFTNEVAPLPSANLAEMLVLTWLPTLLSALVTVAVAVAGGFAVGGLRPLGRFSELLLLPFAPWLFVGTGPLAIESYLRTRDFNQLNTFLGTVPPGWVSIPALFLFTVLFRGLEPRWRAGGGLGRSMVAPAAPMVVLVGLVTWLVTAGQVLWPWLVRQSPVRTVPLDAIVQATTGRIPADDLALGAVLPLPVMLLFLAALVWLQVSYLDRLTIRVGR